MVEIIISKLVGTNKFAAKCINPMLLFIQCISLAQGMTNDCLEL